MLFLFIRFHINTIYFIRLLFLFSFLLLFVRPLFVVFSSSFSLILWFFCVYKLSCIYCYGTKSIPVLKSPNTSKINPFLVTTWHDLVFCCSLVIFLWIVVCFLHFNYSGARRQMNRQQQKMWEKCDSGQGITTHTPDDNNTSDKNDNKTNSQNWKCVLAYVCVLICDEFDAFDLNSPNRLIKRAWTCAHGFQRPCV